MSEELSWDPESTAYIRSRSSRYPDGLDIEPVWTQEVIADVDLVAFEPDPKSRVGASRFQALTLRRADVGGDHLPRSRRRPARR